MSKLLEQINTEKVQHQVSDLMEIKYGFGLPERDRVKGSVPVYASSGLVGFHNESKVKKPSIIIGRKGNVGSLSYSEVESYPIDTVFYVDEVTQGFDLKYAYFLLQRINLPRYGGDSAVPGLSRDTVYSIEVETPKEATQKKIASILSAYDAKIENNNKIIKNLETTAQTIFNEWFVNFRFPGYEKVKMVDSETGEIPEGWETKALNEVLELAYGKALKEGDRKNGNVSVIGSSGVIGFHDEKLIAGPGIVVGRKGNAGSVIWVDDDFFPIDTTFYVKTKFPMSYIYFLLTQQKFTNSDSAVPGLGRDDVYRRQVVVADEKLINKFDQYAQSIFDTKRCLRSENIFLKSQKNQLLAKLI